MRRAEKTGCITILMAGNDPDDRFLGQQALGELGTGTGRRGRS